MGWSMLYVRSISIPTRAQRCPSFLVLRSNPQPDLHRQRISPTQRSRWPETTLYVRILLALCLRQQNRWTVYQHDLNLPIPAVYGNRQ